MQNKIYFYAWLLSANLNLLYSQSIWSSSRHKQNSLSTIIVTDGLVVPSSPRIKSITEWIVHESDWQHLDGEDTLSTVLRQSVELVEKRGQSFKFKESFSDQRDYLSFDYEMCFWDEEVKVHFSFPESSFGGDLYKGKYATLSFHLWDNQRRLERRLFFSMNYFLTKRNKRTHERMRKGLRGKVILPFIQCFHWYRLLPRNRVVDLKPKTVREVLRDSFLLMPETLHQLESKIATQENEEIKKKQQEAHPIRDNPVLSPFQQIYIYRGDTTIEQTIMACPKAWIIDSTKFVKFFGDSDPLPKKMKFHGRRYRLRVKAEPNLVWVLLRERQIDAKGQIFRDLFFHEGLAVDYFLAPFAEWLKVPQQIIWTYDERGFLVRQDFEISDYRLSDKEYLEGELFDFIHTRCSFPFWMSSHFLPYQTINYHYPVVDERGNWLLRVADRPGYRYTIRTLEYWD